MNEGNVIDEFAKLQIDYIELMKKHAKLHQDLVDLNKENNFHLEKLVMAHEFLLKINEQYEYVFKEVISDDEMKILLDRGTK